MSQSINLQFKAIDTENNSYPIDSIEIFDMSQGWTTMLYAPDTTLTIDLGQNTIGSVVQGRLSVSDAYPNPSNNTVFTDIFVKRNTTATLTLHASDGKILKQSQLQLQNGTNTVEIQPGQSGLLNLTVAIDGEQRSIRFVSSLNGGCCSMRKVAHTGRTTKGSAAGNFSTNDILRVTAYVTFKGRPLENTLVIDYLDDNRDVVFSFPISYTAPTVATSDVSEITMVSAKAGGTVSDDGGKPVTARGVCYSTMAAPTISDPITSDGEGSGEFVSFLDNLTPGTSYLVRAYAVNSRGVGYGETKIFTTPLSDDGSPDDGVLPGLFSVSDSQQVHFSQGNLQFTTLESHLTATSEIESGTWRFAAAQYQYIGAGNEAIGIDHNGWIDLFGWGTSGWNSGANEFQPWTSSTANDDYVPGGSILNGLDGATANADWGVYNAIHNGGNQPGRWRTLTSGEWQYLLDSTNEHRAGKISQATISDATATYAGLLLLPDSFELPDGCGYTAGFANGYTTNQYTLEQWEAMQQAGAVFLVAAGRRNGTEVAHINARAMYWSSSPNDEYSAMSIFIVNGAMQTDAAEQRHIGYSVRLVRDASE